MGSRHHRIELLDLFLSDAASRSRSFPLGFVGKYKEAQLHVQKSESESV